MTPDSLTGLQCLSDCQTGRQHVFKTIDGLRWFIRQNRTRLVEAGALVLVSREWHVNQTVFDRTAMEIWQAASKRAIALPSSCNPRSVAVSPRGDSP